MSGALLGQDKSRQLRNAALEEKQKARGSSKLAVIGRNVLLSIMCLFSVLSVGAGATSKAAIWDLGDQIVAKIMNICNPNAVPVVAESGAWLDSALGSARADRVAPIWSTYNPMYDENTDSYVTFSGSSGDLPTDAELVPGNITNAWVNMLKASNGEKTSFLYEDNWSDRSKVTPKDEAWKDRFKSANISGKTIAAGAYPMAPDNANAAFYNAPTVALQYAYSAAPTYVIHPTYSRYGFETLKWTTYGSSCYSPARYLNVIPSLAFQWFVVMPTLFTFGLLRITLGGELADFFYSILVYPLTQTFAGFLSPWAALIALIFGLPMVYVKSRGSIQKILGGALWIGAMMTAMMMVGQYGKEFTALTQGSVVKVSGTMACTIAQQAFTNGQNSIRIGGNDLNGYIQVPKYKANGEPALDAQGRQIYQSANTADAEMLQQIQENKATAGGKDITKEMLEIKLSDLTGTGTETVTTCGSYLDGIYNAYWLGVPLQTWAEGEVGSAQAARDRVAESSQVIGWYQAILNSMYINPNDDVGKATLQSISRWNDGEYTAKITNDYFNIGKPAQWSLDGHTDDVWGTPVNSLDKNKDATVWKTIPFLLNVKYMCKDDQPGTTEKGGLNGADNAGDYAGNKWLYDGTCITAGDGALIDGITGNNFIDRLGLVIVGSWLAAIIFWFTAGICVYIGYQKFVWGFMLIFAPFFLGIAAFPAQRQKDFARKYLEFCISNVVKQIMAVLVLVITVTALGRIVFPDAGVFGVAGIPWMVKPFVALMFLLAAVLFAIPMKRILVAGVKGDSSVVQKTAETAGDVAKGAAAAAAITAAAVATGGGSLGAQMATKGAGRMLQRAAHQKGGLTGALASAGGDMLVQQAGVMERGKQLAAAKAGLGDTKHAGILGKLDRDRKLNKMKKTAKHAKTKAGMSERMALAANARAMNKGEALPYAVGKDGKLTAAGKKAAMKDFNAAKKGKFAMNPNFTAISRNHKLNRDKYLAAREGLKDEFTDENGKVDEKGLHKAAMKSVETQNKNMLNRQKGIANDLLAADKEAKPEDRKYLDAQGNLTAVGERNLIKDTQALDANNVKLANANLAHKLMADNPDKYNKFSTEENPNGNFLAAVADANRINFGEKGLIGGSEVNRNLTKGVGIQPMNGTQAYLAGAPVLDKDMSKVEGAEAVQALTADMKNLSPNAQKALSDYSAALQNPEATPESIQKAHAAALTALHGEKALTNGTKDVTDKVLKPIDEKGVHFDPAALREVAGGLGKEDVALKNSLLNYASAIESHGDESGEAMRALQGVRTAVSNANEGVYANAVKAMPMPENALVGAAAFPAVTTPLSPAKETDAAVASVPRIDPSAKANNYAEAMRAHYGLEPAASDIPDGKIFTAEEQKRIDSGELKPVTSGAELAAAANLNSANNANALSAQADQAASVNPVEIRNAARAELGLAPDNLGLAAPLMSDAEKSMINETRAQGALAEATGIGVATPLANVDPDAVNQKYANSVREHYGLAGSATPNGAALTPEEDAKVISGEIQPQALAAAKTAQAAVPTTPEEIRTAARAELGLAPDSAPATAPLVSASEQAAVKQMQDLGVRLDEGSPALAAAPSGSSAPAPAPVELAAGTTSSTGGTTVDGGVKLTPQAETALATAVAQRGDGSQYVNGMVINPQSSDAELSRAVASLPESHPAREAMTQYNEAMDKRTENPERVLSARNEVLGSMGMATVQPENADKEMLSYYNDVMKSPFTDEKDIAFAQTALFAGAQKQDTPAPQAPALTDSGQNRMAEIKQDAIANHGVSEETFQQMEQSYLSGGVNELQEVAKSASVPPAVVSQFEQGAPELKQAAPEPAVTSPQVSAPAPERRDASSDYVETPQLTSSGSDRMREIMNEAADNGVPNSGVEKMDYLYRSQGIAGVAAAARAAGVSDDVIQGWHDNQPELAPSYTPEVQDRFDAIRMNAVEEGGMDSARIDEMFAAYRSDGVSGFNRAAAEANVPEPVAQEWASSLAEVSGPGSSGENRPVQVQAVALGGMIGDNLVNMPEYEEPAPQSDSDRGYQDALDQLEREDRTEPQAYSGSGRADAGLGGSLGSLAAERPSNDSDGYPDRDERPASDHGYSGLPVDGRAGYDERPRDYGDDHPQNVEMGLPAQTSERPVDDSPILGSTGGDYGSASDGQEGYRGSSSEEIARNDGSFPSDRDGRGVDYDRFDDRPGSDYEARRATPVDNGLDPEPELPRRAEAADTRYQDVPDAVESLAPEDKGGYDEYRSLTPEDMSIPDVVSQRNVGNAEEADRLAEQQAERERQQIEEGKRARAEQERRQAEILAAQIAAAAAARDRGEEEEVVEEEVGEVPAERLPEEDDEPAKYEREEGEDSASEKNRKNLIRRQAQLETLLYNANQQLARYNNEQAGAESKRDALNHQMLGLSTSDPEYARMKKMVAGIEAQMKSRGKKRSELATKIPRIQQELDGVIKLLGN